VLSGPTGASVHNSSASVTSTTKDTARQVRVPSNVSGEVEPAEFDQSHPIPKGPRCVPGICLTEAGLDGQTDAVVAHSPFWNMQADCFL